MSARADAPAVRPSPWRGSHGRTTVGVFSLAFLFAFEALAVATVMPDIAAELDGLRLYAVAFAAPMAAGVVALSLAGGWIDARGPGSALTGGLVVFCAGVLVAGVAPSMPVFLVGRLVHGFGAGFLGVALYVVIAQAYPVDLRPRVFAVLTSAWVLPALVGPVVAAYVAEWVGWRWVFLGVPVLAVAAWLLVRDAARGRPESTGHPGGRPGVALAAAVGVLGVSVAGQRDLPAWPALLVAAAVLVLVTGPRLLPAGTWTARRGLPSMLATRGLIGAAFAGAEAYLPLLLTLERDLTLSQAGWVLTVGAVTWCAGATLAARVALAPVTRVRLGVVLVAAGTGSFLVALVPGVPLVVAVLAWGVAGAGIGMAFSTLSVLVLGEAAPGEEGRVSSALQLNDSLVQALALAAGSALFAGFALTAPVTGAALLIGLAAGAGALAMVPALRVAGGGSSGSQ